MDRAASGPAPVILSRALTKRHGNLLAVDRLDFDVRPGECFGLLGPNGAGKTSTMRMVYGASVPSAGLLTVFGLEVARNSSRVKAALGVVTQETSLDDELTVRENLLSHGRFYGLRGAEARRRADENLQFLELAPRADDPTLTLSGGMKRRLLIARALMNEPRLLLLDEPTVGLDPQARQLVWGKLQQLKRSGVTLLLTTHYLEEAEAICDRLLILDRGRVVAEGRPQALVQDHIGREVLELELPRERHAEALALAGPLATGSEAVGPRLLLHGRDAEALLLAVEPLRRFVVEARIRRASLEDVFLKLTGRGLGES